MLLGGAGCTNRRVLSVEPSFHYPEQGFTIEAPTESTESNLSGHVFDPANAPVSGALVEVFDPRTQSRVFGQLTAVSGLFIFHRLPTGRFNLMITKPGFSRSVTPLEVRDGSHLTKLRFELHPAV
jgi:hypothetical protein